MTEDNNVSGTGEQLSAFLDDELNEAEAELFLRRLGADDSLRGAALRYVVIGDALRGDVAGDPRAIRRRLAGLLDGEASAAEAARDGAGRTPRGWLKPLAGAAVAAAVAVVAITSLQPPGLEAPTEALVTVPVASTRAAGPVSPVAAVPQSFSRRASATPDRLSEYYLSHAEYVPLMGGQGQLVRIVTRPAPAETEEPAGDDAAQASGTAEQPGAR
jgi:sigma-E factor negative regulatory protein RseA